MTFGRRRDRYGQRVGRLDWRPTDLDPADVLDQAFHRAKLGRLVNRLGDEHPPAHVDVMGDHAGATRLHPAPRQGVVDADCQVHGMANLYVAGSSVFPTCGYASPAVTVVVLAFRLADHLAHVPPSRFRCLDRPAGAGLPRRSAAKAVRAR